MYVYVQRPSNNLFYCVVQNTKESETIHEPSIDNHHVDESLHNDNIDEDEVGILLKLFH